MNPISHHLLEQLTMQIESSATQARVRELAEETALAAYDRVCGHLSRAQRRTKDGRVVVAAAKKAHEEAYARIMNMYGQEAKIK